MKEKEFVSCSLNFEAEVWQDLNHGNYWIAEVSDLGISAKGFYRDEAIHDLQEALKVKIEWCLQRERHKLMAERRNRELESVQLSCNSV